ncbi:MAG: hypothetical protein AAF125_20835, partial [Chloroflexota bacterium]
VALLLHLLIVAGRDQRAWVANGVILALAGVLSGHLVTLYYQADTFREGIPVADLLTHETCFHRVAFRHDVDQPLRCYLDSSPDEIDFMAAHNLAGFRHTQLPQALTATDNLVVIVTEAAAHGVHIRDRMLPPGTRTLHLYDETSVDAAETLFAHLPTPPQETAVGRADAAVLDVIEDAAAFDVVRYNPTGLWDPYAAQLPDDVALHEQTLVLGYNLSVMRYVRTPETIDADITFGGAVRLVGWRIPSSLEAPPCAVLELESVWELAGTPAGAHPAGVAFVMVGADGAAIARDQGITGAASDKWEAGRRYFDARALTIPCDTPPGDYPLMVEAYDFDAKVPLEAAFADGTPVGGLYFLTSVRVTE